MKQKEISVEIIVLEGEKIWKFRRLYIYLKKKKKQRKWFKENTVSKRGQRVRN